MLKSDRERDFWVVLKGVPVEQGLCQGFDDKGKAETNAQQKTTKAKAEFGKDWKYEAIPNPNLKK